jgi:predicted nucleic acid-binding protein
MSSFVVVLDACTLFPASLRDTLLRAAEAGLYRLQLTDEILEEVKHNLTLKKGMPSEKAIRLITVIKEQFPEALVSQHHQIISSMTNHEKDRHVLAAAVICRAQMIVTQNLKDFPSESLSPFDIEAQSPEDFLINLLHLSPDVIIKILIDQANELRNPSRTIAELLDTLRQHAPNFVNLIRKELYGYGEDVT